MEAIQLSEQDLNQLRKTYQDELTKTLAKLQHLKSVLEQLGGEQTLKVHISTEEVSSSKEVVTSKEPKITKERKRRKKRGPKAVWEDLVVKRLRSLNKPMTYEELTDDIIAFGNIPDSKRANTKQAIINVVFRLRQQNRKVNTFSMGRREKYIALKRWFDEEGNIRESYSKRIQV
jgi:hypothetical protein